MNALLIGFDVMIFLDRNMRLVRSKPIIAFDFAKVNQSEMNILNFVRCPAIF
jgi:hypothetical protein